MNTTIIRFKSALLIIAFTLVGIAFAGSAWLVPTAFVADGGPGQNGIPALTNPAFVPVQQNSVVRVYHLAIAVQHEGPDDNPYTLSYWPLTGSALAWLGTASHVDSSFRVSGLLYNSNLLLYDRDSGSIWSQMRDYNSCPYSDYLTSGRRQFMRRVWHRSLRPSLVQSNSWLRLIRI